MNEPVVDTKSGRLRGTVEDRVYRFLAVSYAAPTGELRVKAPAPVKPWAGIRDAIRFGPVCPQLVWPPLDGVAPTATGTADR